jgi:hypothetical protein
LAALGVLVEVVVDLMVVGTGAGAARTGGGDADPVAACDGVVTGASVVGADALVGVRATDVAVA